MVRLVGVRETKATLSRLLQHVASGDEVVITRRGEPVARLVPVRRPLMRQFGTDRGRFVVPDDFDAPLADDFS
jgi:prevent-host-death family protein